MSVIIPATHEEWLQERRYGIGASDAGSILGMNPWKSNVELWAEKTGQREPEDISSKPQVQYGHDAEPHIRALFALDHPELQATYESPYKIIRNDDHPFIFCTPDGELTEWKIIDEGTVRGRKGGLEIKTTEIMNARQWADWNDRIPQHYYAQVCHQMLAAGWEFVWLRAQIKYTTRSGEKRAEMREYYIERKEAEEDIKAILEAEIAFWEQVQQKRCPALILPDI